MKKNDFFIVGAQKAATTTINKVLEEHGVIVPLRKETKYFADDRLYTEGAEEEYEKYFTHYNENTDYYKGEVDPDYLYYEKSANRIYNYNKDAKIIIIIRNPIERALSQYYMSVRVGVEKLSFVDALREEESRIANDWDSRMHYSYISRGLYYDQIMRYMRLFGQHKVKIMLFEDLIADDIKFFEELFGFLGLEFDKSKYVERRENESYGVKSKLLSRILNYHIWVKNQKIRNLIQSKFKDTTFQGRIIRKIRDLNKKRVEKYVISVEERAWVGSMFAEDIDKLSELLDRDLRGLYQ